MNNHQNNKPNQASTDQKSNSNLGSTANKPTDLQNKDNQGKKPDGLQVSANKDNRTEQEKNKA